MSVVEPPQIQTMTTNNDLIERLTEFFEHYYDDEIAQLANRYPTDQQSLFIDYEDISEFNHEIADDLLEHPEKILDYFEEALRQYPLPVMVDLDQAHVRVCNLPDGVILDVSDVTRHHNIGRMLGIRGQVQKVSKVQPRILEANFECKRCGTSSFVPQKGENFQEPQECAGCERQGPFSFNPSGSTWTDHQSARLQQPPERTQGGNGQSIDVHLEDDLIEEFDAGDRVTLTGILDIESPGDDQSRDFDMTVDTRAVVREQSDYEDVNVADHLDEIRAIANGSSGDPYELLVDSINPSHKGDSEIKLAIGLMLFGGWQRGGKRGDSHILLMGDPGCGKSTFLQAVDDLAPRSTYASGKGASASGLTAAAVNDDFGDSEWGLEAGALVLANGGIACIDEIDKVKDDAVSSLHDALESQKVRVNKAGINTTLNAVTALLAAGNPKHGRFDPYEPIAQQIDLGPTLMSRFDLYFMVSDSPDAETDKGVVDHMMRSRRAAAKQELGEKLTDEERSSVEPAIPQDVLRAYIAYAKEEVTPYLREENTEAREHLKEGFLKIRLANAAEEDNPVPVTYRQEEAIERLAEASARVRLSDEVTKEDVERALSLVRTSMKEVGVDPETGEFDADIVETGTSKNQRDRKKHLKNLIEELEEPTVDELAEAVTLDRDRLESELETLRNRGHIYEMDGVLRVL